MYARREPDNRMVYGGHGNILPSGEIHGTGWLIKNVDGFTEFWHIIKGEAGILGLLSGEVHEVRAGDSFVTEEGLSTEWHVPNYIRKCFQPT